MSVLKTNINHTVLHSYVVNNLQLYNFHFWIGRKNDPGMRAVRKKA